MWVGRGGRMDDGLLDVTILPPDGTATQVVQSRRLYDGSLGHWPGARRMQVRELGATGDGRAVHLDLDGENPGRLPTFSASFLAHSGSNTLRGARRQRPAARDPGRVGTDRHIAESIIISITKIYPYFVRPHVCDDPQNPVRHRSTRLRE